MEAGLLCEHGHADSRQRRRRRTWPLPWRQPGAPAQHRPSGRSRRAGHRASRCGGKAGSGGEAGRQPGLDGLGVVVRLSQVLLAARHAAGGTASARRASAKRSRRFRQPRHGGARTRPLKVPTDPFSSPLRSGSFSTPDSVCGCWAQHAYHFSTALCRCQRRRGWAGRPAGAEQHGQPCPRRLGEKPDGRLAPGSCLA